MVMLACFILRRLGELIAWVESLSEASSYPAGISGQFDVSNCQCARVTSNAFDGKSYCARCEKLKRPCVEFMCPLVPLHFMQKL